MDKKFPSRKVAGGGTADEGRADGKIKNGKQ
jgi:hypothetical protein